MSLTDAYLNPEMKLIDVRETAEFSGGHIGSAFNFPLSRFEEFVSEIIQMEGPKVLYCRSGMRSGQAMNYLKSRGLNDVFNGGSMEQVKRYISLAA